MYIADPIWCIRLNSTTKKTRFIICSKLLFDFILLAKFEPFLVNHIEKLGNRESGKTNYSSKTVCDGFIFVMGHSLNLSTTSAKSCTEDACQFL